MRRILSLLCSIVPCVVLADNEPPVVMSSALNIPTPTFQEKTYRFDGFYVGTEMGYALPTSNMRDSINGGFALIPDAGYQIADFRMQVSPFYFYNSANGGRSALNSYGATFDGFYDIPFSAVPITPRLSPFVGMGIGYITTSGGTSSVYTTAPLTQNFAYQAIIGLQYHLTLNTYLRFSYHYFTWSDDVGAMSLFNLGVDYHFYS